MLCSRNKFQAESHKYIFALKIATKSWALGPLLCPHNIKVNPQPYQLGNIYFNLINTFLNFAISLVLTFALYG